MSQPALVASVHLPHASVRDPAELLDIDVDQVPGSGVLVAADGASTGSVEQLSRFRPSRRSTR